MLYIHLLSRVPADNEPRFLDLEEIAALLTSDSSLCGCVESGTGRGYPRHYIFLAAFRTIGTGHWDIVVARSSDAF